MEAHLPIFDRVIELDMSSGQYLLAFVSTTENISAVGIHGHSGFAIWLVTDLLIN